MARTVDFTAAEELLQQAAFDECRLLWSSSNYVYLALLCADRGARVAAVYKPEAGETPLWDFPDGLYRREVAAYQLSRALDWPFIPPTVIREGPQGVGSLQLFVDHDQRSHFFEQREDDALVPQLMRIAVFDFIANNADRKGGHCLLDSQSRIWGIDHGLCFHPDYKLRTVIWDWAEQPIPGEWLDDVRALNARLDEDDDGPIASLRDLLTAGEMDMLRVRIEHLLRTRTFPTPGPHRSYPWPLV